MKRDSAYRLFFGIDQTGAAVRGGQAAKDLPCALLAPATRTSDRWKLSLVGSDATPLAIPRLGPAELKSLFARIGIDTSFELDRTIAIVIDCVFGLAKSAWPAFLPRDRHGLWDLFEMAAKDEDNRSGFGLKPAATYFRTLLDSSDAGKSGAIPVRECESIAGANSVFRTRPYQKNIQCGTYRVWRDLGSGARSWTRVWMFDTIARHEELKNRPMLFEGYPSLFWREIFGTATREPERLPSLVKSLSGGRISFTPEDATIMRERPDWADAAVLAFGAWYLQDVRGFNLDEHPRNVASGEGWILGLRKESPSARQRDV